MVLPQHDLFMDILAACTYIRIMHIHPRTILSQRDKNAEVRSPHLISRPCTDMEAGTRDRDLISMSVPPDIYRILPQNSVRTFYNEPDMTCILHIRASEIHIQNARTGSPVFLYRAG
jgi:hypothetical protein